jgi:hypothetical protein
MLMDVPAALDDLCRDNVNDPICVRRHLIEDPRAHYDVDDYYIWDSKIGKESEGGLTREQFNDAGRKLLQYAVLYHPTSLLRETFRDLFKFYSPNNYGVEGGGYIPKGGPRDVDYMHFITEQDHGRFVPKGALGAHSFLLTLFILNTSTVVLTLFYLILYWKNISRVCRAACGLMLSAWLLNDGIFALLSGPDERYHIRILGIFVPIALILNTSRTALWRALWEHAMLVKREA